MKAVNEIIVTREEIKIIKNFFEVCEKLEVEEYGRLDLLESIANEDKEYCGINIIIKE